MRQTYTVSASLPVPVYSLDVCAPSKASLFTCTPNSFPLCVWERASPPLSCLIRLPFYWIVFITVLTCCNSSACTNQTPNLIFPSRFHCIFLYYFTGNLQSPPHLLEFSLFSSFQSGFDDHHSIVLVKVTTKCLCG